MTAGLLLLSIALIAANGFFVGAEFAVLAARRGRLEPLLRTSRECSDRTAGDRAASAHDLGLPVRDHLRVTGPWRTR